MEAQVDYKYIKDRKKEFINEWDKLFSFCEDLTNGWWGAQGSGYCFRFKKGDVDLEIVQLGYPYATIRHMGKLYLFSNISEINAFCIDMFGVEFN